MIGLEQHLETTILLATDREALLAQWLSHVACESSFSVRGQSSIEPPGLIARLQAFAPDVLLLDVALLDGLDATTQRQLQMPGQPVRIMLLCEHDSPALVVDVLRRRFHGLLAYDCAPLTCVSAIRAVRRGELWLPRAALGAAASELFGSVAGALPAPRLPEHADEGLTRRESQVVERLRRGCSNKEIARELGIMEDTVKKHLQGVFAKLGVHRRTQVAVQRWPGAAQPAPWSMAQP